jgi:hypothetical protein
MTHPPIIPTAHPQLSLCHTTDPAAAMAASQYAVEDYAIGDPWWLPVAADPELLIGLIEQYNVGYPERPDSQALTDAVAAESAEHEVLASAVWGAMLGMLGNIPAILLCGTPEQTTAVMAAADRVFARLGANR